MLNKYLALFAVVVLAAGCGVEARTYVMTKPRVGLDQNGGNGGCIVGKCPPASAPVETTRKVYVLELTRPVPESEVKKIEETAVNAITAPVENQPASNAAADQSSEAESAQSNPSPQQPVVTVVGERPGTPEQPGIPQQAAAAPDNSVNVQAPANGGNMQATTYTVQKDDTLQKISKKVYGTYGKWYKIYKANKDKIKNPNVLRAGMVLTIPSIK